MYFADRKLIFVHIPKTGGNFFARTFVRYTDERLVTTRPLADGIDRFAVSGIVTEHKHQPLAAYARALGGNLAGHEAVVFVRRPLARMLSLYFSPHRWIKAADDGTLARIPGSNIRFDAKSFQLMLDTAKSAHDLLSLPKHGHGAGVGRAIQHPSGATLRLYDYEKLDAAVRDIAARYDFTLDEMPERKINASAQPDRKSAISGRPAVARMVALSRHGRDDELFDS